MKAAPLVVFRYLKKENLHLLCRTVHLSYLTNNINEFKGNKQCTAHINKAHKKRGQHEREASESTQSKRRPAKSPNTGIVQPRILRLKTNLKISSGHRKLQIQPKGCENQSSETSKKKKNTILVIIIKSAMDGFDSIIDIDEKSEQTGSKSNKFCTIDRKID